MKNLYTYVINNLKLYITNRLYFLVIQGNTFEILYICNTHVFRYFCIIIHFYASSRLIKRNKSSLNLMKILADAEETYLAS